MCRPEKISPGKELDQNQKKKRKQFSVFKFEVLNSLRGVFLQLTTTLKNLTKKHEISKCPALKAAAAYRCFS